MVSENVPDDGIEPLEYEFKEIITSDNESIDAAYESLFGYKPSESPEQVARKLFSENVLAATASIVQLAAHATHERIRFDAAKYIHASVCGKPGTQPMGDTWKEFFKEMGIDMPVPDKE